MAINSPKTGIHRNVPFDEYLEWDAVNNTSLSAAAKSMLHFQAYVPNHTTEATAFGTLVHAGVLEPDAFAKRYAVMPDLAATIRREDGSEYANVKATKQYKAAVAEWRQANADKEIVEQADHDNMLGMLRAIAAHPLAGDLLMRGGQSEASIVWIDGGTGIKCKARLDKWYGKDCVVVDLKTTRDASRFGQAIGQFAYHRQAAFYADGLQHLTERLHEFWIVAVEKEAPWGIRAAPMADWAMGQGRVQYQRLLKQIAECRRSGEWPGYDSPEAWEVPAWATEDVSLKVGGEEVQV